MQFLDCKITLSFSNQKIKDRSETLINKGMYEVKFKFIVSLIFLDLFFHSYEFLFLTLAAGAAPCIGQFLKGSARRDVLLGVALFRVVGVFAGAFELCHNRIFVLGLKRAASIGVFQPKDSVTLLAAR